MLTVKEVLRIMHLIEKVTRLVSRCDAASVWHWLDAYSGLTQTIARHDL